MQFTTSCLQFFLTSYYQNQLPIVVTEPDQKKYFWQKVDKRMSANLVLWITRTKCMQKKWAENMSNRPQTIALLKVHESLGPIRSALSEIRQCSNFEIQERVIKNGQYQNLSAIIASGVFFWKKRVYHGDVNVLTKSTFILKESSNKVELCSYKRGHLKIHKHVYSIEKIMPVNGCISGTTRLRYDSVDWREFE